MSLRFLYTLCFAILVLVISILSSFVIYQLYKNFRKDLFVKELQNTSITAYEYYLNHAKSNSNHTLDNSFLKNNFFGKKKVQIINSKDSILLSHPNQQNLLVSKTLVGNKTNKIVESNFLYNYIFFDEAKKNTIIVVATDDESIISLKKLKFFLILVPFLFSVLAFLGGNLIVITAVKPLTKLAEEMTNINENNLTTPVKVGKYTSETNKLANNFNNLLQRLSEAFNAQKNFVQHASHELRTPLATMYATTQAALLSNHTAEEYKTILQSLKQDQNNLIELTNALLLLSQFEKLKHKPTWHNIRIDDLLYESMAYTKKLFSGMIIDFAFDTIPENESYLEIKASEVLLRSAFTNLIKNAFLYSSNQKTNIILIAEENKLEIHFENFGKHLTTTEIDNLKEPFLKSDNVGRVKGFGLGLSIVQRIVNIHNASFVYEPIGENKNRFTIKFK
jgi:signal transduction histidine kinase